MKFSYIDRKKEKVLVLLPGWGTDSRVFSQLDLEYNYLFPDKIEIKNFTINLRNAVIDIGERADILGWSLGGILAAQFMACNHGLADKAFFVAIKERYTHEEISGMKKLLIKNSKLYLEFFYNRCLNGHSDSDAEWFHNISSGYKFDIDELVAQLDFLEASSFPIEELKNISKKIIFINGAKDAIIPPNNINGLKNIFKESIFYKINNTGHISFLHSDFKKIVRA
ncbi:transporter [Candidatus Omnitrophus magneticus]|uniref:Transporter n=1 Tax=Candidatus Omnitrophus magneticus TaxID=1609969 RepID=A0A0F0CV72_9BACT|nr:transporter [Candidatus Omnitrophus magneticus]